MGNKNMKYAKSKRAAVAEDDIFNEKELDMVKEDTGKNKKDQLNSLTFKVRQFEEKVAREEQLRRA